MRIPSTLFLLGSLGAWTLPLAPPAQAGEASVEDPWIPTWQEAEAAAAAGDYAGAAELLEGLLPAGAQDYGLHLRLGQLRAAAGDWEAARVHYTRAAELSGGTEATKAGPDAVAVALAPPLWLTLTLATGSYQDDPELDHTRSVSVDLDGRAAPHVPLGAALRLGQDTPVDASANTTWWTAHAGLGWAAVRWGVMGHVGGSGVIAGIGGAPGPGPGG